MAGKYGAIQRQVVARNIYEATLTSGTDITISYDDWVENFLDLQPGTPSAANELPTRSDLLNVNTNLRIVNCGIYSNFADGLVFKKPSSRLNVRIKAQGIKATKYLSGAETAAVYSNDKTLTGVGTTFTADVSVGDLLFIPLQLRFGAPRYIGQIFWVTEVTDNTHLELNDYPIATNTALDAATSFSTLVTTTNSEIILVRQISNLNELYAVDEFITLANFVETDTENIILRATIYNDDNFAEDVANQQDTAFMTHTIDSAFNDETVTFDVVATVEATQD